MPDSFVMLVLDVRPRWSTTPDTTSPTQCPSSEWCGYAQEAAVFLRHKGFDAAAMSVGVVEWQAGQTIGLIATDSR